MESSRVGLIGFGLAGSVFHAPLIAATPALRLTAIVTADEARRRQASSQYRGVRLVRSAEELLADPRAIDLVVIASPNRTHVPIAIQALRAGLHVVVDKPFAPTAAEGERVIEEAERRERMVTVFQNRRWDGDFLTLRKLIDDGTLGDVMRIESRFERWRPVPRPGWKESGDVEDATGVLYDLGSHLIDQVLQLFGPATSVYAELERRRPTSEVVDDAFVAIEHASGVRSHLHTNMISGQPGPRYRVLGTRASFTKFGLDGQEAALRSGARPGDAGWGEDDASDWGVVSDGTSVERVPTMRGEYETFYARVAAAVHGRGAPPVDARDAVATAAVIDSAMQSASEEKVVAVESRRGLARA